MNAAVVELIRQQLKAEDHSQNDFDWLKQSQFGVINVFMEHNTCLNMMFPASDKNAIMTAIEFGQTEVVKTLIDWGADVKGSCQGYTPLIVACIFDEPKIAKLLLEKGAVVNHCAPDGVTPISASISGLEKCAILCVRSRVDVKALVNRCTLLVQSALVGHDEVVSFFFFEYG